MAQPALPSVFEETGPFANAPGRPLAGEISDYLNHLAAQHSAAPLILAVKICPLNIAEGLAHEFAAHERELEAGEKGAAHECANAWHPLENAFVRHQLCGLIAEMTAPLAEATLAHHLLFILTVGKDLQPPYAADRLSLCAGFDSKRGFMRQRFAPERETAPPPGEARIEAGMTLVCEPLESGYYRIPDDKRHRNSEGLLMSDPLYSWTMQSLLVYFLALANLGNLESGEDEVLLQAASKFRFLLRLLALMRPETISFASPEDLNRVLLQAGLNQRDVEEPAEEKIPQPKIVFGRFAGSAGSVHARNVEHRAATQVLERTPEQSHHLQQPHAHIENVEPRPE